MQSNDPLSVAIPDEQILSNQDMIEYIKIVFLEHLPFNKVIGFEMGTYGPEHISLTFKLKPNLIGNRVQGILHGGVTSSALDTVGGILAVRAAFEDTQACSYKEFRKRFSVIGTIDMRVDFLRPGRGQEFTASAYLIRKGNRVTSCRMELHNEQHEHIASGVANYFT